MRDEFRTETKDEIHPPQMAMKCNTSKKKHFPPEILSSRGDDYHN